MNNSLYGITRWGTWIAPITTAHSAVDLLPSGFVLAQSIDVDEYSAILLRGFGKNAENETVTCQIVGWMGRQEQLDATGFGHEIWNGQLSLGAETGSFTPNDDGKWGTADATWFEVDLWDSAASGGFNTVQAVTFFGGDQSVLLLPTLGYSRLQMTITNMAGMAEFGCLWRGASKEGIL